MRVAVISAAMVAVVAGGFLMWAAIAPGEEQRKALLKNLPESNPVRMEETRRRNALVMQALKEAAESNDNIARGVGGSPN